MLQLFLIRAQHTSDTMEYRPESDLADLAEPSCRLISQRTTKETF